ncbi:hypothetical protein WR25_16746 [Diploscapter pachys]|uniref:SMC hinge domain-containing protein n=1 Tax=Diploscapter pachys TaxID=2018661 RepID=A0A2A2J5C2_9BILA|nr:hypothetical protein WR25_16746 [Diploscapter pachys]
MHITKVIITDFLSYKGRVEITDFSQHLNVVVGRNGSGKSNFFKAIEFVLTDSYKNVRERDRLSLINQSSTAQRPNFCKVEIVLDNSDKSIPLTDYPKKVTIARIMDKKKDKLTINDKVVTHKETAIKELEILKDGEDRDLDKRRNVAMKLNEVREETAEATRRRQEAVNRHEQLQERMKVLTNERKGIKNRRMSLEAQTAALKKMGNASADEGKRLKEEIDNEEERIEELQKQLEDHKEEHQNCLNEESKARDEMTGKERQITPLRANCRFASERERNQHLDNEINQLQKLKDDIEKELQMLNENLRDMQRKEKTEEELLKNLADEIEEMRGNKRMEKLTRELADERRKLDEIGKQLNDAFFKETNLQKECEALDAQHDETMSRLSKGSAKAAISGMVGIQKIIEEIRDSESRSAEEQNALDGYYGSLMDLCEVEDLYADAVETIAKNKLFSHIVKDHTVVQFLLREFDARELPGQPTFIPLNHLTQQQPKRIPPSVNPDQAHPQVLSLLDVIQFDSKFEIAFQSIFGAVALVKQPDENIRKTLFKAKFNLVTLSGVEYSNRGTLSGGYSDPSKRKMPLYRYIKELQKKLRQKTDELEQNHTKMMELKGRVDRLMSSIADREEERKMMQIHHEELIADRQRCRETIDKQKIDCEMLKREIDRAERMAGELGRRLEDVRQARDRPMQHDDGDRDRLDQLEEELKEIVKRLHDVTKRRSDAEKVKNGIEAELVMHRSAVSRLIAKREQLRIHKQWNDEEEQENGQQNNSSNDRQKIEKIVGRIDEFDKQLREMGNKEQKIIDEMTKVDREKDTFEAKIAKCIAAKENAEEKISKMGALPPEFTTRYQNLTKDKLEKRLRKVVKELKEMGNVNRNAEGGQGQLQGKGRGDPTKIRETLDQLDREINAAVQEIFKNVRDNFQEIFKKIVPNGYGEMRLSTDDPESQQAEASSVGTVRVDSNSSSRSFTIVFDRVTCKGINLIVSFTGNSAEDAVDCSTLSGGQLTMVTLALILAIQRVCSAPFYVFDELDAEIDASFRKIFADLLNEYCGNSQFIVTTFHPELLGPAEARFGVKFINKIHNSPRPLSLCTSQPKQIDFFPPQQTLCNALELGQKQKEKGDYQKELQQSRAQGFSRSRSHSGSRSRSSSDSRSSRRSRSPHSKKSQAKGRKTATRLRDARGRFVSMGGARKSNKKSSRKSTKSARSRRSSKGGRRAMRRPADLCPTD